MYLTKESDEKKPTVPSMRKKTHQPSAVKPKYCTVCSSPLILLRW